MDAVCADDVSLGHCIKLRASPATDFALVRKTLRCGNHINILLCQVTNGSNARDRV